MDAPKCKLCGERHYGLCKHAKPRPAAAPVAPKRAKAVVAAPVAMIDLDEIAPALERISDKFAAEFFGKPKYDRNTAHRAYMKGYMRKRRAADKLRKERE